MGKSKDLSWLYKKPIAHRGMASDDAPENSLLAFKRAADMGVASELDVYGIRKGGLAVFHDPDLIRMCKRPRLIWLRKEANLKKYKLRGTDQYIPTMKEVLETVDGKAGLLIELKVWFTYKKLCDSLIELLRDYKGDFALCGFSTRAMRYLRKKCDFPVGMIAADYPRGGLPTIFGFYMASLPHFKTIKPDFLSYNHRHVPSRATRKCEAAGIPILGWTIHNEKQFEKANERCKNLIIDTYHFPEIYQKYADLDGESGVAADADLDGKKDAVTDTVLDAAAEMDANAAVEA